MSLDGATGATGGAGCPPEFVPIGPADEGIDVEGHDGTSSPDSVLSELSTIIASSASVAEAVDGEVSPSLEGRVSSGFRLPREPEANPSPDLTHAQRDARSTANQQSLVAISNNLNTPPKEEVWAALENGTVFENFHEMESHPDFQALPRTVQEELILLRDMNVLGQSQSPDISDASIKEKLISKLVDHAGAEVKGSVDKGGHGGTLRVTLFNSEGKKQFFFLKPYDAAEARHYDVIEERASGLLKFMPQVSGKVMIDGKPFLVMSNSRMNSEGKEVVQVADIKLAGKIRPQRGVKDINPIASLDEVRTTGRSKSKLNYNYMWRTAKQSPGYMVCGGKIRALSYGNSKNNLIKGFEEKHTGLPKMTAADCKNLISQLEELKATLDASGMGMIGASVIILRDPDEGPKIQLIDPAHMQLPRAAEGELEEAWEGRGDARFEERDMTTGSDRQLDKLYFGDSKRAEASADGEDPQLAKYRASNGLGIEALQQTLLEYQEKLHAREVRS